jgi:hypothetical protein
MRILVSFGILTYCPNFEKIEVGFLITILSVCEIHGVSFGMPEAICMKHGMFIMAPEPISKGVLHKSLPSVCVTVCAFPPSLLGNGSVKTFTAATNIYKEIKTD